MTPTFMGSEPVVADGGKYAGVRVFEAEERTGLTLAQALSAEQRAAATIDPATLFGGRFADPTSPFGDRLQASSGNDNLQLPYAGIRADALSAGQQELLGEVVGSYVNRLPQGHADEWSRAIQAKLSDTYLAWIGDVDADSVFYYRVHSPVVLIEFDHVRGIAFDNDQPSRQQATLSQIVAAVLLAQLGVFLGQIESAGGLVVGDHLHAIAIKRVQTYDVALAVDVAADGVER